MRKKIVLLMVSVLMCSALPGKGFTMQLLSREEGLKKVFGADAKIVTENKDLTEPKLSEATKKLDGSLTCSQKGARIGDVEAKTNFDFYFAEKDGKKTGVAIIDAEPGKWGPVEFIIAMDLNGTVTRVEVLSSEEKRGQPITRHSFLSQFEGKTSKDSFELEKDITGVSGATISSRCAAFAVKKAVVIYNEIYLNQ